MIERQTCCSTFIALSLIRNSVVVVRYFKLSELSLSNIIIITFTLHTVLSESLGLDNDQKSMEYLFNTKMGREKLFKFLEKTKIASKKWLLQRN